MTPAEAPRLRLNLANCLSGSRLLLTPVLLLLAWYGLSGTFLAVFILVLVTDIFDGKVARWLDQSSDFGTRLDSYADLATYISATLSAYWLRPEFVSAEAPYFYAVVAGYVIPELFGIARFGKITSYHTRGAVLSAYLLGASMVVIFADGPAWPFRLATAVFVLAEIEEIAITLVLPEWHMNVKSLGRALEIRRERSGKTGPG